MRLFLWLFLLSTFAGSSWADLVDNAHIGIYADAAGTIACQEIPPGSSAFLHVIAVRGDEHRGDVTGAEFRIEIRDPDGWILNYDPPAGAIMIGNAIDVLPGERHDESGVNIAFSDCQVWDADGRIQLGTLFVRNVEGIPTELRVKQRSEPTNNGFRCALFTDCTDLRYYKTCSKPRVPSSCTRFVDPKQTDLEPGCDGPFFVFTLNGQPDPEWTIPDRLRDADREVIVTLTQRTLIELPEEEAEARFEDATIHSPALEETMRRHAVEWVAKAAPCFDLADTVGTRRGGGTVRLIDWSKIWLFTVPTVEGVLPLIEDLMILNQVVFAEANGLTISPAGIAFLTVHVPNPIVRSDRLRLNASRSLDGRIEIFDARGRRVRILLDRRLRAGSNDILWDGTDDSRRQLSAGVYFVHVSVGKHRSVHKVVYMR